MSGQDVRVGFVGCGRHATGVLLPAAREAGMDLASVCDLDRRRAQRTARRFGAFRAYQDLRKMIDEMDLDAVLVCGPPEMHAEAAAMALERGCHVWTEVPPAPTAAEAEHIAQLADARGLIAQPGLMMRFAPAYERLKRTIDDQDFGEPTSLAITWWPAKLPGHDEPLLFDAIHAVDLARMLLGEIEQWQALAADEAASMALRFASGALGSLSFAAGSGRPREVVAVAARRALAVVQDRREVAVSRADREESTLWRPASGGAGPGAEQGFLAELQHFLRAVLGEVEPRATMSDAAAAMALIETLTECGEVRHMG
ncbi:MAG: Gfo/Idh/MocA family oxidoreductase [Armatimonadota bacterium]|nr:Gfo/Idh/MocA family oxidoreductase [Armatimonadota bacterium]